MKYFKISNALINKSLLILIKRISLLFLFVLMSFMAFSQIDFAPFQSSMRLSKPRAVSIGDVNNDGLNDVIIVTVYGSVNNVSDNYCIVIFLQDEFGKLQSPVRYSYIANKKDRYPLNPCIINADLNNDGLNDVVIAYNDSVGVFYQNNMGTLDPIQYYYSGYSTMVYGISSGDLNNDGLMDIAVAQATGNVISVLFQKKSGGFTAKNYPAPVPTTSSQFQIEVGDINNDGLDDAVLRMCSQQKGIYVYTQNNSGTLNSFTPYINSMNLQGTGLAIGDLNNDKVNDIVCSGGGNMPSAKIAISTQDTLSNLLNQPIQLSAYEVPNCIKIADLNCDGRNEIISTHMGHSFVTVFEQDSNNLYDKYELFKAPNLNHHGKFCMDVGDINNDGKADIVMVTRFYMYFFINQSKPSKPKITGKDSLVCVKGKNSVFKNSSGISSNIIWELFPAQAGSITSFNNDSCMLTWNDEWQGVGELYITAYDNCGNTNSDTLLINKMLPPVINLGSDTILCKNNTLTLFADTGFQNYEWQDKSTNTEFIVNKGGVYYVEVENECGRGFDTIIITEVLLPEIELKDTFFCSGNPIQIKLSKPEISNVLWQDNSTDTFYTISNSGTYSLLITDTNNCINSKTFNVNEFTIPIVNLPNDTSFCDNIDLTINVYNSNATYHWQDGSVLSQYNITSAGLYSVSVSNICGANYDSIIVVDLPLTEIDLRDTVYCSGDIIQIDITKPEIKSVLWQDNSINPKYTIANPGLYTVNIIDSNNCLNSKSINVEELFIPELNWPIDTTVCEHLNYTLDVTSPHSNYLWNNGSNLPQFEVKKDGTYSVNVSNICGQINRSIYVTVENCKVDLFVPNTFTPNGDGLNDVLYLVGENVKVISFIIYNRWGEKVFESNNIKDGWDGTFHGKLLNTDVFGYLIVLKSTIDGKLIRKTGSVTLLR